ncbi:helix-turn-helix domain-containing protein [Microbulbifer sp.]|uniref:helix-turn-helix domain-containing protein n=1 Tax=Microbulbifer sp. TaxID=1908541 RepID=UPI003F3A69C4
MPPMNSTEQQQVLVRLGERFRRLRLARNISQEALAENSGVGLSTLKRFESGRGCNLAALVQLLAALGHLGELESFFAQLAERGEGVSPTDGDTRRRASSPRKYSSS